MACRLSAGTSAGAAVGVGVAAVSGAAMSVGFAAGSAAGLAASWTSMSDEERQQVKDQLAAIKQRLAELSSGSLERLPPCFLTDLLMKSPVPPWVVAGGGVIAASATQYLQPEAAKQLLIQATELIDTTLELFTTGSPACLMLAGCCVMTFYQASMCYDLWSFTSAANSEELAKLVGIDLAQLKADAQELLTWWDSVKRSLDIDDLETFMSKSDSLARKIKQAQRALEVKRDQLAANQRKSEVIQAASGVALLGFGGAALKAGELALSTATAGAAVALTGVALSTWFINNVDAVVERLNGVYSELGALADNVKAPVCSAELRIQMVDSPQQPRFAVRRNQPTSTFPGQGHALGQ